MTYTRSLKSGTTCTGHAIQPFSAATGTVIRYDYCTVVEGHNIIIRIQISLQHTVRGVLFCAQVRMESESPAVRINCRHPQRHRQPAGVCFATWTPPLDGSAKTSRILFILRSSGFWVAALFQLKCRAHSIGGCYINIVFDLIV